MKINPAVQGGAEQGSARVGRGQGASLPMDAFQALLNQVESRTRFSAHAKARIEQRCECEGKHLYQHRQCCHFVIVRGEIYYDAFDVFGGVRA